MLGLESALEIECVSALVLSSPAAGLDGAPGEHIHGAGAGCEGMEAVAAKCLDADVLGIALPHREAGGYRS